MKLKNTGIYSPSLYRESGVDIQGSGEVKKKIRELAESTYNKKVLAGVGLFGTIYDLGGKKALVLSADGVGTKLEIAQAMGSCVTIGIDLVNHCINDVLCEGAMPIFFLDYIAQDRLRENEVVQIVEGICSACLEAGIPLIGGELAQMPGFYLEGKGDAAGFIGGIVEKDQIIDGSKIKPGDVLLGFPSAGLHTSGYSMVRKIFFEGKKQSPYFWVKELGGQLGRILLAPHQSYLRPISQLLENLFRNWISNGIHGIAHITGGGLEGNIVRILPDDCQAQIHLGSWPVLPIFQYIQKEGRVFWGEMYEVFNMGIGMVLIVSRESSEKISQFLRGNKEPCYFIGEITHARPSFASQNLGGHGEKGVRFYTKDSY